MYCLDYNGRLHLICPLTLVLIHSWERQGIEDFVLLEDEGSSEARLTELNDWVLHGKSWEALVTSLVNT